MRNTRLENGSRIVLVSEDKTKERTVTVERVLGEGANSIAYEVTENSNGISFVMKECFPSMGAAREADGSVCWLDDETETNAKKRVRAAYEIQRTMQRDYAAQNTNAHLVDEIFTANNTLYTLVDKRNADTYDQKCDQNLRDAFRTARAVAKAVKAYHDKGYLHLDIKPENVMLYPETREMVMLMDFDSVVSMEALANGAIVTYSPPFAAPEQIQGRRKKLCPATDIYAIGAMTFARVMGRHPDASDRSMFSRWDYSESHFFDKVSEKCKRLTTEFFNKTVCASIRSRVQTMDELILMLDVLIEESDPKRRYLISSCDEPTKNFVGRKNLLNKIKNSFTESNIVFLYGMGGIGKTELAKYYAKWARDEYDTVCLGKYQGSLEELFTDAAFNVANSDRESAGFKEVKTVVSERTLLIIDGYDTDADRMFDAVSKLPCKILFTSRVDHSEMYGNAVHVRVNEMSRRHQRELFEKECGGDIPQEQSERILNAIEGYTLLIPLIAKQYKKGLHSIEELADRICAAGIAESADSKVVHIRDGMPIKGNVYSILREILTIEKLDDEQKYVMGSLALLGDIFVERTQLLEWIGKEYNDTLNELVESSWVLQSGVGPKASFSLHNVIQELMVNELAIEIEDYPWVQNCFEKFAAMIRERRAVIDLWRIGFNRRINGLEVFYGYDYLVISRYARLAETIINNLFNSNHNNSDFIISTYFKIVGFDISYAMNCTVSDSNILLRVLHAKCYSDESEWLLYAMLAMFELRNLVDVHSRARSAKYVREKVSEIIEYSNRFTESIQTHDREAETMKSFFDPFIRAGILLSRGICYTKWPKVDEESANRYFAFIHDSIAKLELNDKYILELKKEDEDCANAQPNELFEVVLNCKVRDRSCLEYLVYLIDEEETQSFYENLVRAIKHDEPNEYWNGTEWVSIYNIDTYYGETEFTDWPQEEIEIWKIRKKLHDIYFKLASFGFSSEKIVSQEAMNKMAEAKELVKEAEKIVYDNASRKFYFAIESGGMGSICMVYACLGMDDKVIELLPEYLEETECFFHKFPLFKTLVDSGYEILAKKLLREFVNLGIGYHSHHLDEFDIPSIKAREIWSYYNSIISLAETVGDTQILEEYRQKQAEHSSTGFTFKTE